MGNARGRALRVTRAGSGLTVYRALQVKNSFDFGWRNCDRNYVEDSFALCLVSVYAFSSENESGTDFH